MARPRKQLDTGLIEKLASIGCSIEEIASQVNASVATLYRRYEAAIKKGHQLRNISIRQMQWLAAMDGNTTMLIWLGKQYLGQADKQEVKEQRLEIGYGSLPTPAEFANAGTTHKPN